MARRVGFPASLLIAGLLAAPFSVAQTADAQRDAARERARERREEREREREIERRRAEREARAAARRAGGSTSTGGTSATPRLRPASGSGGTAGVAGRPSTAGAGGLRTTNVAPTLPVADNIEELRTTRPERRKVSVGALRQRWGGLVAREQAREELKKHGRRLAYLQRIRTLAAGKGDQKLVQTIDKLLTTEETRHADAMNKLRTAGAP